MGCYGLGLRAGGNSSNVASRVESFLLMRAPQGQVGEGLKMLLGSSLTLIGCRVQGMCTRSAHLAGASGLGF